MRSQPNDGKTGIKFSDLGYTQLLEEANEAISDACHTTTKQIFELATEAKSLWKDRSRFEKLAYLKKVCSNQVLDGATLRYELRNPFRILSEMKQKEDWSSWPISGRTSALL